MRRSQYVGFLNNNYSREICDYAEVSYVSVRFMFSFLFDIKHPCCLQRIWDKKHLQNPKIVCEWAFVAFILKKKLVPLRSHQATVIALLRIMTENAGKKENMQRTINCECIVNKTIDAHYYGWLINHSPSQVFGSYVESRTVNSKQWRICDICI